jgi:hypothetical protein
MGLAGFKRTGKKWYEKIREKIAVGLECGRIVGKGGGRKDLIIEDRG